jgi:hypothetical protein
MGATWSLNSAGHFVNYHACDSIAMLFNSQIEDDQPYRVREWFIVYLQCAGVSACLP